MQNMKTYIALLRGINVGGKNKLPMAELKTCFEELGFADVSTFIASGNVMFKSDKRPSVIKQEIEKILPARFKLDSDLIKVLILTRAQLESIIRNKPKGFGEQPNTYHSDIIFLIDMSAAKAMSAFNPREGVDTVWPGKGVIYSQRLSAKRTQSRLSKVIVSPLYKSMTIRNWNTTTALLKLLEKESPPTTPKKEINS